MAKTRLTALLLLLSMLFFCACESGAAGTADTGAAVTDGGAGGIGGAASDTVVTTLADREDPEAEYITTLKTYDMRPVEPAVNMYSTFQYVDGDYFYASIKPYPQKELCCFDRDGGLVWSRAIPDHEDGAEMYAVVLPDDRMIVVYNRINQVKEGFLCLYDADGTLLQTTPVPEGCKINTTQFQAKILPGEDGGIRVVMLVTTAMSIMELRGYPKAFEKGVPLLKKVKDTLVFLFPGKVGIITVYCVLYGVILNLVGFAISTFVFLVGSMLTLSAGKKLRTVLVSLITTVAIIVLFQYIFRVQLP